MKLGDIIKYLDILSNVIIWQTDAYINEQKDVKIFEGFVMDIPWIYLDYYLNGDESISADNFNEKTEKNGFIISVREKE